MGKCAKPSDPVITDQNDSSHWLSAQQIKMIEDAMRDTDSPDPSLNNVTETGDSSSIEVLKEESGSEEDNNLESRIRNQRGNSCHQS